MTYDEIKDGGDVYVRLKDDKGGGALGYVLEAFVKFELALVVGLFERSAPTMYRFNELRVVEPPK